MDDQLIAFAINGLRSVREELFRMSNNVADMIQVLSDVLAEEHMERKTDEDEYDISVRGHRHGDEM